MTTKRMNVQIPQELLNRIDKLGKSYPTRNAVIVALLNRGLEAIETK